MRAVRKFVAAIMGGLVSACLASAFVAPAHAETPVPRKIVVLYHSEQIDELRDSALHQSIQMPLNHLGLVVVFHDMKTGMPSAETMAGARGILTWFTDSVKVDEVAYLKRLHAEMDRGARLLVFQHPGVSPEATSSPEMLALFKRLMERVGVRWVGAHHEVTYRARITYLAPGYMDFERKFSPLLPPYDVVQATGKNTRVFLRVELDGERSDLIVAGPEGGYAARGYVLFPGDAMRPPVRAWHINPFRYFRLVFATRNLPKPDITTMSGRRLYYSHIDGDGWRNLVREARYVEDAVNAAELTYREIFLKYPDLPVTLGPVVGDLDTTWYGDHDQLELARRIFLLHHVEAGHHTHSHPFEWQFFKSYKRNAELPYLYLYPLRPGRSLPQSVFDEPVIPRRKARGTSDNGLEQDYDRPRAYAVEPFSVKKEVFDSTALLNSLMPPGKRVELYLWSGNTSPFEAVMAATKRARLRNMNGGDGRMFRSYRSYAFVAPYGRWVGKYWQPYTSHANEHIYTGAWKGRFYAYIYLLESLENTGRPIRVTPINVYYHLYLVERQQGLSALKAVLDKMAHLEIAPIAASRFAAMSDGFISTRFVRTGARQWRIEARDGIETVRFDNASADCVDFSRSTGVTGQRHHQGSLYISLDRAVARPVLALATCNAFASDPPAKTAYLVSARWRVWALRRGGDGGVAFTAEGFGPGGFRWRMSRPGDYRVRAVVDGKTVFDKVVSVGADHRLAFTLPRAVKPVTVTVSGVGA